MLVQKTYIVAGVVLSSLLGTFPLLSGCSKPAPKPLSRLEVLEQQVIDDANFIEESEADYKAKRAEAEAAKDKEEVRRLDAINVERIRTERRVLEMKKKELKKLQKEAGKASGNEAGKDAGK